MIAQPAAGLPASPSRTPRRRRIIAATAATAFVCSGLTSCSNTQIGLSIAAIAAVVVGTTVGVTLAVQHSHHTLQGCIYSGVNGLELRLPDANVYALTGQLADVKVGDKLKIHGAKVKKVKGGSAGGQVFVVEKVNRDYGPCAVPLTTSPAPSH